MKSVPTEITEGKGIEKSTSTDGLSTSLTSCQSGDYLSCESELSRSLEMYRLVLFPSKSTTVLNQNYYVFMTAEVIRRLKRA